MLRRWLDGLYAACGALAAAAIVAITVVVAGQVLLNLIGYLADLLFGKRLSLIIPSYVQLSGYALAFATFLALGLALRRASHIRVTLLEARLPQPLRRTTLLLVTLCGMAMGALFSWSFGVLVYHSFLWGDRGVGIISTPLWIPQSVLLLGVLVFLVAAIDTFVEVLRSGDSASLHASDEAESAL